jgi:hypothetical protein
MDVSTEAEGDEGEGEGEGEEASSSQEEAAVEEQLKSPRIPEYSHLPPDPSDREAPGQYSPLSLSYLKEY